MRRDRFSFSVLTLLAWLGCIAPCAAEPAGAEKNQSPEVAADSSGSFLRLVRDGSGELVSMETAVVRYTASDDEREGLVVDLIGVVHIGEQGYYKKLNQLFDDYDAVLYELVAPEGTRVSKDRAASDNPVSMLQNGMKQMLELDYQLDWIDYSRENFVHADMSPEDFARSMSERGESIWTMMFRMMGQGLAQQNKSSNRTSDAELLLALFDPNRALALKRIMAEQFEDLKGSMSIFDGPEGSTIITERNKKALEVLARQIKEGKKRLAIFYGAGHMADMERRLLEDFGVERESLSWLEAWDLRDEMPQRRRARRPPADETKQEIDEEAQAPLPAAAE